VRTFAAQPNREVRELFDYVGDDVIDVTNNRQRRSPMARCRDENISSSLP
jgi:hypothetical protein